MFYFSSLMSSRNSRQNNDNNGHGDSAVSLAESNVNNSGKTERRRASLSERSYAVIGVIVAARLHEIIQRRRPATITAAAMHALQAGIQSGMISLSWPRRASVIRDAKIMRLLADHRTHSTVRPSVRPSVGSPARPARRRPLCPGTAAADCVMHA